MLYIKYNYIYECLHEKIEMSDNIGELWDHLFHLLVITQNGYLVDQVLQQFL